MTDFGSLDDARPGIKEEGGQVRGGILVLVGIVFYPGNRLNLTSGPWPMVGPGINGKKGVNPKCAAMLWRRA